MKLFQWIISAVFTTLLLIAVAIIIAPRIIDPNDYRETITELVKDKIDRDLKLKGDLSVSIFPWLGIKTQGLSLAQPNQIAGDMLTVQSAQLRVKLIPLFSKQIEIDTIVLDKPELTIVTLKNGVNSFTGLNGISDSNLQKREASSVMTLVIQGLELIDGTLIWDDRNADQYFRVSHLNVKSGNLIGAKLAKLNADGLIEDITTGDQITFAVDSLFRIDTDSLSVFAQQLSSELNYDKQPFAFSAESLILDQLTMLKIENSLLMTKYANRQFTFTLPELDLNLDSQLAELSAIEIKSGDLIGEIKHLNIKQLLSAPSIRGVLDIQSFNATKLINDLDIEYTPVNENALSSVALSSKFTVNVNQLELHNLEVLIDQSKLSGSFKAKDYENMKIEFDLALDKLNLDDYLPNEQNNLVAENESVSRAAALAIPMAAMKGIYANGNFSADQLISGGLELNDINVLIESTPSNVTITPKANLYDGSLGGRMVFSTQIDGSTLEVQNEIDLVSLAKFLTAADVSEQLSGIGSLALDLQVIERKGLQTNQGTINLSARNGAIKGFDLKKILDQGLVEYNKYRGKESEGEEGDETVDGKQDDETRFAELYGTFHLNDYLITNNDFEMKAPLFRISGSGEIDVIAETINYLVNVSIVNTTSGQGGETLEMLNGLTIPIRFEGSLIEPNYSIDMKALYQGLARKEIEQKKSEYFQEKLGIENGGQLSTKEILEKLLLERVNKQDGESETEATNVEGSNVDEEPKSEKDQLQEELTKKLLEELFK